MFQRLTLSSWGRDTHTAACLPCADSGRSVLGLVGSKDLSVEECASSQVPPVS